MRISQAGLDAIKRHEGLRLAAYPDPASGGDPWTIGYGHTRDVERGQTTTAAQAEQFLRFVSDPRNQAQLPPRIPYGVTNRGANALIDPAVLPNLPTAPDNIRTALFINDRYWLENIDRLNQRFNAWVSR